MRAIEIQDHFSTIEDCIDDAALLCFSDGCTSQQLKDWIVELDERVEQVKHALSVGQNPDHARRSIASLREVSERALEMCADDEYPHLRAALADAHQELMRLHRELH